MTEYILSGLTQVRIQVLARHAIRLTHAPKGTAFFPPDRPWLKDVLLPQPPVAEKDCRLRVSVLKDGLVNVFADDHDFHLAEAFAPRLALSKQVQTVTTDMPTVSLKTDFARLTNAVELGWTTEAGEGFYGWGEWFNAFRRTTGQVELNIRDAIAMIQHQATYSGIPLFFSQRGYAVWLLNSHPSQWTLDPETRQLRVQADGPAADYVLMYGPTFKDILTTYTALTGRPPLIPRWAFGLMVTGYPQEPQAVVMERVQMHRWRNIPLDAVILDYHWEDKFHNFQWRASLFPDPPALLAELKKLGVRLGLILTPFVNHHINPVQRTVLNRAASNLPLGEANHDDRDLAGYEQAKTAGYLAHPNAAWWLGAGGMVDFTNPAAAQWWHNRLQHLYTQGVAFFKNDDGEYLPFSATSANGMTGREYHNVYGFYYSRAMYAGMEGLDNRRALVYARSLWAGSQRFPAMFLGDQKPTFEHMRATLRAGLNLSLMGIAYWTPDVFGLDGPTTPETHMRYAQWALFAPVARYFWRPPAIDDTRFPWSHGAQAEVNFRDLVELRYRLLPYYVALGWQAHLTGVPLMRPLVVEFPHEPRLAEVDDQAMLGEALLLAPVVQAEAVSRRVELPVGVWHDFWSRQVYRGGGQVEYPAPLHRLPLLVRGGSVVPLGPVLQHIPEGHMFDTLELHVYPPFPATGVIFDDDGLTREYQRGAFSRTEVRAEAHLGTVTLTLSAANTFAGQPAERTYTVVMHALNRPTQVALNGQLLTDWHYNPGEMCLRVTFTVAVAAPTTLTLVSAAG